MAFTPKQLGQSRPSSTTAASVYSPASGVVTQIKTITICNTSGAAAAYSLFHDDNGTTYDETTALYWNISLDADQTETIDVNLAMSDSSGNLAVKTSVSNALTFTVYGAEQS